VAYLTPNAADFDGVCRVLVIPSGYSAIVMGALAELTLDWNWEASGDQTIAEATAAMEDMFDSAYEVNCMGDALNDLTDVTITNAARGDILTRKANDWDNENISDESIVARIAGGDVAPIPVAASRIVGRKSSGSIAALTAGEVNTILAAPAQVFPEAFYALWGQADIVAGNVFAWTSGTTTMMAGKWTQNPAALDDEVSFTAFLRAGTYLLSLRCNTGPSSGIAHFQIQGETDVNIDLYSSGSVADTLKTASVKFAADGLHKLAMKAHTKNASSTNYQIYGGYFWLIRTGAY